MSAHTYLVHLPWWWYVDRLSWWRIFAVRTFLLLYDKLSIGPQLQSLFAPYHNDRTAVGRALGFTFRLCWILAGSTILLLLTAALLLAMVVWLGLPFGLLIGVYQESPWWGMVATLSALIIFWFGYVLQPKYQLAEFEQMNSEHPITPDELRDFAAGAARRILKDLPLSFSTGSLVHALSNTRRMERLFKRMELTDQQLLTRIAQASAKQSQVMNQQTLAQAAVAAGRRLGHQHLTSTDLFLGLIDVSPVVTQILTDLGVHRSEIEQAVAWVEAEDKARQQWKWWRDEQFHRAGGVDRGWTSGWTPTMKQFSVDVTAQVAAGRTPYIIGRDKEIQEVVQVLERTTKHNVLLLGEPGVGKSSIVDGIAQAILRADTSPVLADTRVIQFDLGALLGGATTAHELEQRLNAALQELTAGKTILFIDGLEHLVRQTGAGTIDATAVLLPFIEAGSLRVIGSTTPAAFRKHLEMNTGFTNHFQVVTVEEPDNQTAQVILQEFASVIEQRQGVTISLPAIKAAVELSRQYIHDRVLPEKAIDLLDEVAAAVAHQKKAAVSAEDVAAVIAGKTGVPVTQVTQDEATKLNNLEQLLHQRIIGQDTAVSAVANALRRARAGLRDSHRPMAVLLFVGPTGVGKTELAKTIAENYFGSEDAMVRLDMSEYQQPSSIAALIGSPSAQDEAAQGHLTTAVRERPFTVVLLDELEKAHPQVLDLFLQVFDDGRLTDGNGRTVSFNQTIIIATSNAGARSIQDAIRQGYTTDQIAPAVKEMLAQQFFRPEFLNRFDDIIVFRALTVEETMQVVRLMLKSVEQELAAKDIVLTVSEDAVQRLAQAGYDPLYGARPLRHLIQDKVENSLAKKLLAGELKRGMTVELTGQNLGL